MTIVNSKHSTRIYKNMVVITAIQLMSFLSQFVSSSSNIISIPYRLTDVKSSNSLFQFLASSFSPSRHFPVPGQTTLF
jgi:hypothetical protein